MSEVFHYLAVDHQTGRYTCSCGQMMPPVGSGPVLDMAFDLHLKGDNLDNFEVWRHEGVTKGDLHDALMVAADKVSLLDWTGSLIAAKSLVNLAQAIRTGEKPS